MTLALELTFLALWPLFVMAAFATVVHLIRVEWAKQDAADAATWARRRPTHRDVRDLAVMRDLAAGRNDR